MLNYIIVSNYFPDDGGLA